MSVPTDSGTSDQVTATPVTYNEASRRYGSRRHAASERYDELSMRDHLARAHAKLKASGEYDPARHGTRDIKPLDGGEHLELLATAEYLARSYKPSFEVDLALRAGASWQEVAEALGTDEAAARAAYRAWADGQHDMWAGTGVWSGEAGRRFGMSDAEHAEAIARVSDSEMYPGGIGDPDNISVLAGEPEPGAAKAYAATHAVLCAHADQDGQGAHWLQPGEKCTAGRE